MMHHPYYAGFVFGNAWGKVSAASHCAAAKARKNANKNKYKMVNVDQQIAKWCTEADQKAEEQDILFGTGGGSSPPPPSFSPGQAYNPYAPPTVPGNGNGNGTGEEEESSMLLPIIGLVALAALGGGAALLFMKPKKGKKKKGKKKK